MGAADVVQYNTRTKVKSIGWGDVVPLGRSGLSRARRPPRSSRPARRERSRRQHANHLVEESISLERERDQSSATRKCDPSNCPGGVAEQRSAVGAESGKVMASDQSCHCLPGRSRCSASTERATPDQFKRRKNRSIANQVAINFSPSPRTSRENADPRRRTQDANRGRQVRV